MNSAAHQLPARPATSGEPRQRTPSLHPLTLRLYPDPVLRRVCTPVETFDSTLRDLVHEMFELMRFHGGIGLAGPQAALEQRLFVAELEGRDLCLVNVEIQDASVPGEWIERCLSLPGIQVSVSRPEHIRVTGYDELGRKKQFGATGLWARVIQHELDHLNGVLICDHRRPAGEACARCSLPLPAGLVEEQKHRSNLLRHRSWHPERRPKTTPPHAVPGGIH